MEKTVFLLVGPRAAGKSTYGKLLMESDPELKGISRDEIAIRLFGSEHSSSYDGVAYYTYKIMLRLVKKKLAANQPVKLVFDCWTGDSQQRVSLIKTLKELGATRIVALFFTTPLENVEEWFWKKPGIAKMNTMSKNQGKGLIFYSDTAPKYDYELFHEFSSGIDSDGFDEIIRVNPNEKLITLS